MITNSEKGTPNTHASKYFPMAVTPNLITFPALQ